MNNQDIGLIAISFDEIPAYLREGKYFQPFRDADDGVIFVPANVLKADTEMNSAQDLRYLLESLHFWVAFSEERISKVLQYILSVRLGGEITSLMLEFEELYPFMYVLLLILHSEELNRLDERSGMPLAYYVRTKHPCAVKILMHFSRHKHVQTLISDTNVNDEEKDIAVQTFINQYTLRSVASEGALSLLMFLYENGLRDFDLCTAAANNGHFACLQYLVQRGCKPGINTYICAACNGHLHIVEYLRRIIARNVRTDAAMR